MVLRVLLSLCIILSFSMPVFAQEFPDLEVGKGELAIENLCASTTGQDVVRTYHDSGSLHVKAKCLDGKMNGIVKKYHPNGKIQMKSTYEKGVLNGTTKIHDENGTIIYRDEYENGTRVQHKYYNEQGELVSVEE